VLPAARRDWPPRLQVDLADAVAKPLIIAFSAYRSITKLVLRELNVSGPALLQLGTALVLNRSLRRVVLDTVRLGEAGGWLSASAGGAPRARLQLPP
jgi:hypothetical protein